MPTDRRRRTRLLVPALGLALLLAGAGLWLGLVPGQAAGEDDRDRIAAIEARSGVRLLIGDAASMTVPGDSRTIASQLPGVSLDAATPHGLKPSLDGIDQSLSVYPPGAFARIAPAIVLAGHVRFGAAEAGGTDGPNFIVLTANPVLGAATNLETARLGLHHEFSSLIWQRQPLIAWRWNQLMPAGWQPDLTAATALGRYGQGNPPPETGLLSAYGATTSENDFNTYAETALADPEGMRRLAAATPLVATKLALLIEAYIATDPAFRTMFRQLGYATTP